MDWKYYIPHVWDEPTKELEDVWLWPAEGRIQGNMGNKINLDICTLRFVIIMEYERAEVVLMAKTLDSSSQDHWFWPYPVEGWGDEVSMLVNCSGFTKPDLVRFAKLYLEHAGYEVGSLLPATEKETFREAGGQEDQMK